MKKLLLLTMLVGSALMYQSAEAQKKVNVQININSQPEWGPAGYNYAEYYYLPDADIYYNVNTREYTYKERGRWVNVRMLPPSLRNIDLYKSYKVVINDRSPWLRNDNYKKQYAYNRNRPVQISRRDDHSRQQQVVVKNEQRPVKPPVNQRDDHQQYGGNKRH